MTADAARSASGRLGTLSNEVKALRERLRGGGGPARVDAHHEAGKLTARERIELLLDPRAPRFEMGLFVGHDGSTEHAAATAVVTCVGRIHGREVVVVANDATVDGEAWRPETVTKMLRAQEAAMRCRIPLVYLIDAPGTGAAVQAAAFPGRHGAGRVLYYAALIRRHLGMPQFAAVMGPSSGSAAYLPALSDVIVMVEGTSFLALGGPELVRQATGRDVSAEELGGAGAHTAVSGVAHYLAPSDPACIERLRGLVSELPLAGPPQPDRVVVTPPVRLSYELYDLVPDDPRQAYDVRAVLECLLDGDPVEEFQAEHAPEMICATGFVEGIRVGVVANARGMFRSHTGGGARFGGVLYAESARKVAYFVETVNRHGTPLLFVHDVAGFMVGPEAEHAGLIRAGAELIEATATARVPRIAITLNHASGAGYYAMAGQGVDPDFTISLPTGLLGTSPDESGPDGAVDALGAAARGFVDEVLLPEELRPALGLLLRAALQNPGPHLGPFQVD